MKYNAERQIKELMQLEFLYAMSMGSKPLILKSKNTNFDME